MPILIIVILLCICRAGFAEPAQPFLTRNQNPLLLIYGLPTPSAAFLPAPGTWRSNWSINLTNTLNNETTENEALNMDGEVYQLNLHAEYGLTQTWSLGMQLVWLEHHSGFMDQPIEEYHDWLGLPQGDRLDSPRNQLFYRYERNGTEQLRYQESTGGWSDIQLTAARCLNKSFARDYSLHMSLKLPTGKPGDLTGSGAADFAAWLAGRETLSDRWQVYGSTGMLLLGRGDILSDLQEDTALFGTLGLHWQYHPTVAFKVQAEWNSAFYKDTGIQFMGDAMQLSFGAAWQISRGLKFDIALTEDIKEEASPDVTFHFALRFEHE
jgi:hypothetical protein